MFDNNIVEGTDEKWHTHPDLQNFVHVTYTFGAREANMTYEQLLEKFHFFQCDRDDVKVERRVFTNGTEGFQATWTDWTSLTLHSELRHRVEKFLAGVRRAPNGTERYFIHQDVSDREGYGLLRRVPR